MKPIHENNELNKKLEVLQTLIVTVGPKPPDQLGIILSHIVDVCKLMREDIDELYRQLGD